ncbi:hypothetical protein HCA44_12415 [Rhodococcus sp. HNM0569]|nr:hypothetical protein [Rhodococcus sp. HNM0569]
MRVPLVTVLGALLGLAAFLVARTSLTDDAYISLSAARNLALHGEWSIVEGLTANTSTSPLNVLTLALLTLVTRVWGPGDPLVALALACIVSAAVVGWALARIIRTLGITVWWAAGAAVLVILNPFVTSALGLEVLLIPAVVLVVVSAGLERRPLLFGVAAGAAVLVRLDLAVVVVVLALFTPAIRHALVRTAAAFAAVTVPWYLFSWLALGSAIPDTFLIKQGQASDVGGYGYLDGPIMFFHGDPWMTVAAFGPAVLGVVALVVASVAGVLRRHGALPGPLLGLGVAGVAYYAAYVVLDTVPYHWYYVTPLTTLSAFAALAAGYWCTPVASRWFRPLAAVTGAALVAAGAGTAWFTVERGVPWTSPPVFGNWASAADYERVGREVGAIVGDVPVRSPGEIGALAYYCECHIVDEFSDRGIVVAERLQPRLAETDGLARVLLRANYAFLDYERAPLVPGYALSYGNGAAPAPSVPGETSWDVYSEGRGAGHLVLTPLPAAP